MPCSLEKNNCKVQAQALPQLFISLLQVGVDYAGDNVQENSAQKGLDSNVLTVEDLEGLSGNVLTVEDLERLLK